MLGIPIAEPDRQRRTPVSIARERPIDVVGEPFAEALLPRLLGVPVDASVPREHAIAVCGRAHEPRLAGVVEQRRTAAPAVRIRMLDRARLPQRPATTKLLDDQRVCLLHELATDHGKTLGKLAARIDRLKEGQTMPTASGVVVGAKGWRHVHDAAPVLRRHERLGDDDFVLSLDERHPIERTAIAEPLQRSALHALHDAPPLEPIVPQHRRRARLGEDDRPLLLAIPPHELHVRERGMHRERHVGDEGPRSCRPDEDSASGARLTPRSSVELQRDIHTGIPYILVALSDLVAGKRCPASRAVRENLVSTIQEILRMQRRQRPPYALHVVVRVRDVWVFVVEPVANARAQPLPVGAIPPHALATELIEALDADLLDLLFAADPQLLLDLDLHRQAMRVPPRLPEDAVSLHHAVATEEILDRAREHVMDTRLAVRRGWTLEEHEVLSTLTGLERAGEDVLLGPARQHFLLEHARQLLGR